MTLPQRLKLIFDIFWIHNGKCLGVKCKLCSHNCLVFPLQIWLRTQAVLPCLLHTDNDCSLVFFSRIKMSRKNHGRLSNSRTVFYDKNSNFSILFRIGGHGFHRKPCLQRRNRCHAHASWSFLSPDTGERSTFFSPQSLQASFWLAVSGDGKMVGVLSSSARPRAKGKHASDHFQ